MSSEAPAKSFYLNVSTRPPISKKKAQKLDVKKWEISLGDFNENKKPISLSSSESNELNKELNLCKKKINEIPKKIFFENALKSLKRKSMSEKNIIETDLLSFNSRPFRSFSSDQSLQTRKKTTRNTNFNIPAIQATFEKKTLSVRWDSKPKFEQMQYEFSENALKSLKKKSFDKSTFNTDFLCLKDQPNPHCSSSFVQFPQKEKRTCLLQNANFKNCNIEKAFEKKTLSLKCTEALLHDKSERHTVFEKVRNVKKPSLKHIIPEEFSCDNSVRVLPKSESLLNVPLTENYRTAECFEEVKQAAKISHEEHIRNLLKTDLLPTLSAKSIGVGSEWVHSLEQLHENHLQNEKKIQNLIVGGYCDQILKFQRRELSEKVISEHRNGFKAKTESVLMRVNSIIHDHGIIVAECCLLDNSPPPEKLSKDVLSSSFVLNEGLTYIALFQKSSFYKQQMKAGKSFLLSLPWHFIQVKSFKCPVIICKNFKGASLKQIQKKLSMNERIKENAIKFQDSELSNSVMDENKMSTRSSEAKQKEDLFFMWKKRLNIYARIQRIWNHRISVKFLKDQHISRLTLLLQARNGDFYLLSTSSHLHIDWFKFVQSNEGHFYFFESLNVSHRLEQKRYPKLFNYLENLLKESKVTKMRQNFVYQLGIDEMTKKPSKIIESDFPPFLSVNFQSLSSVIKNPAGRVSCKARVLLQYSSILYISDESIFHSGKFVKVILPEPPAAFLSKSGVCITEALIFEGHLYLDEYSQVSCIPPPSNEDISILTIQNAELSLRPDLNVADVVSVKGNITNVDENNACIWLQCNFCKNENLVQNSEEVIFCEECCLVVKRPFLKVKMSVTVVSESLQNILLNIELLSLTSKRILSLKENSYQPQCNVSDVLGKEIGPMLCYVRGVDILESHTIFYLNEVEDYH